MPGFKIVVDHLWHTRKTAHGNSYETTTDLDYPVLRVHESGRADLRMALSHVGLSMDGSIKAPGPGDSSTARMLKVRVAEVDGCENCGDKLGHLPVLDHDDRGNPVYGKHKLTLSCHRWASRVPGRKEHKNRDGDPVLVDVVRNDLCAVLCCDCDRATHIEDGAARYEPGAKYGGE